MLYDFTMFWKRKNKPKEKRSTFRRIIRFFIFSFLTLIGLLLAAAIIIPTFFKDDIEEYIKKEISAKLNVTPHFDIDDVSLTLFSNFPDITIQVDNIGLEGKGIYKGDTLFHMKSIKLEMDIWSLMEDSYQINSIDLYTPMINAYVNENGIANFDIVKEDTTSTEEVVDTSATKLSLKIEHWGIHNANVKYVDKVHDIDAHLIGVNHVGSGQFDQLDFDLKTDTKISKINIREGKNHYFKNDSIHLDFTVGVSNYFTRFEFKKNNFSFNMFGFGMDGVIEIPAYEALIFKDFHISAKETDFKNLLSLVPESFLPDFDQLKTEGTLLFDANLNGELSEKRFPEFDFNLGVNEGSFQYEDLPVGVKNIQLDFNCKNKTGDFDSTQIALKRLSATLGKADKISASLFLKGLTRIGVKGKCIIDMNLSHLKQYYHVSSIDKIAGLLHLDLNMNGNLSEYGEIPSIYLNAYLKNGKFKTPYFDKTIENIQFNSSVSLPSHNLQQAQLVIKKCAIELDEEPFDISGKVSDLMVLKYDLKANGVINLDKWLKLYPVNGIDLGGRMQLHQLNLKGDFATILQEKYEQLDNSGELYVSKFRYFDKAYIPGPIIIDTAELKFTPTHIHVNSCQGKISKSDFNGSGTIQNYLGYTFYTLGLPGADSVLKGNMNYSAQYFDVDEWLYGSDSLPTPPGDEQLSEVEPLEVYPLPRNINFVIASSLNKVKYDNLSLTSIKGNILFRDGKVTLEKGRFNLLGGQFKGNASYSTEIPLEPSFSLDLDVNLLSIQKAYGTFVTVKKYLPSVDKVKGEINSHISLTGKLAKDYYPIFTSISMDGMVDVLKANVIGSTLIDKINKVTNLKEPADLTLKNTKIYVDIHNGFLHFKPFQLKLGQVKMDISGRNGITGAIDYDIDLHVPPKLVNQLKFLGIEEQAGSQMMMNLAVGGTFLKPKVKIVGVKGVKGASNISFDTTDVSFKDRMDTLEKRYYEENKEHIQSITERSLLMADSLKKRGDQIEQQFIAEGKKKAGTIKEEAEEKANNELKSAGEDQEKRKEANKKAAEIRLKAIWDALKAIENGKLKGAYQKSLLYFQADALIKASKLK